MFKWLFKTKCKPILPVRRLLAESALPSRAHTQDGGLDLRSTKNLTLEPGERTSVDVGLAVGIPAGCAGFTMGRSSMNKAGVYCITGVIDAGYTGAISVILHNQSGGMKIIQAGDRIAQLVIMPVILAAPTEVDVLDESERGSNGFGSSGR